MMADEEFLRHFITEPIYIIPENDIPDISLVEEPVESIKVDSKKIEEPLAKANESIKIKGNNSERVLVLVDEPEIEFINNSDEVFLAKILKAVKLDIKDIAIVNLAKNPGINREVSLTFDATKYLVFGVKDEKIFKDGLPPYQIIEIENKQILSCGSLSKIASDKKQKELLWEALQKLFLRQP